MNMVNKMILEKRKYYETRNIYSLLVEAKKFFTSDQQKNQFER